MWNKNNSKRRSRVTFAFRQGGFSLSSDQRRMSRRTFLFLKAANDLMGSKGVDLKVLEESKFDRAVRIE